MRTLSALDLYFLVKELSSLEGARLDKVYQPSRSELLLQIHKEGKYLVRILPGVGAFLSSQKVIDSQLTFGLFLRKQLGNARVSFLQKKFERVLEFRFSSKDEKILIVELFSKGNIILCDKNYKVLGVFEKQVWKDRKTEIGGLYSYPISSNVDIRSISLSDFSRVVRGSSRESIVKTLAIEFSLGGVYAEEVCSRANVDKSLKSVSDVEIKRLFSSIKEILEFPLSPVRINNDVFPFPLMSQEGISIDSFSQELEKEFLASNDPLKKSRQKLSNAIIAQEQRKKDLEQEVEAQKRKAELLYENYDLVTSILKSPVDKLKDFSQVKEVDLKKRLVVVDL